MISTRKHSTEILTEECGRVVFQQGAGKHTDIREASKGTKLK